MVNYNIMDVFSKKQRCPYCNSKDIWEMKEAFPVSMHLSLPIGNKNKCMNCKKTW